MEFVLLPQLKLMLDLVETIADSNASWEMKYDLIFSDAISKRVFSLVHLDYFDPDTSYEEDVRAFVGALQRKVQELDNS